MLEREFDFYRTHQDALVEQYRGRYIVIVGEEVVGSYASEIEAYTETQKKYPLGTFLIQPCLPGEENYTQTFHSRVSI